MSIKAQIKKFISILFICLMLATTITPVFAETQTQEMTAPIFSLPSNGADGQLDATVKGITEVLDNRIKSTINTRLRSVGKNLVKNGKGEESIAWWIPMDASISIMDNKFRVTCDTVGQYIKQEVSVKQNTNYYLSYKVTDGTATGKIYVSKVSDLSTIRSGAGYFNSGENTSVLIRLRPSAIGYCDFDSIQLEEGTTATPYEIYKESTQYIQLPEGVDGLHSLPNSIYDKIDLKTW